MKKNLVLVVALIALIGVSAFAQDAESDFQVKKSGSAVTITKYVGKKTTVNIPRTIQNTAVTAIGDWAFDSASITGITIPDSVKTIGAGAFVDCKSLVSIIIPNSVARIAQSTFGGCTSLASVTIPNSVTAIEVQAFEDCTGLKTITIPNSVKSIRNDVFTGCTGLASVTFQGTIPSSDFHSIAFKGLGDIRAKFYAADAANGNIRQQRL